MGESGCGKSVTAMSILRLIPEPPGDFLDGQVAADQKLAGAMHAQQMQIVPRRGTRLRFEQLSEVGGGEIRQRRERAADDAGNGR